uniref:Vacuolar protein sorting-associated protein 33B n=1 Tax=Timema cristinae TaxID=61476 RepID=A0A7R9GSR1_TIMCR|nr:unnamed protein product [Timema cristinae]
MQSSIIDSRLDALHQISQKKLSEILVKIPGKKDLIIDHVLMKPLDRITGVSFLRPVTALSVTERRGTSLLRTCYSAVCDRDKEQGYSGPVTALSVTERRGTSLLRTCYSAACDRNEEQGYFGPVPVLPVTETRSKVTLDLFLRCLSHGVEKLFKMESSGVRCLSSQWVYIILTDLITVKRVSDQINAELSANRRNSYHLIFVPCNIMSTQQLLEEEGVYGEVTIHTFSWELHRLDLNVLSLELPNLFKMIFLDGDTSFLPIVAHSLWSLQLLFGKIPLLLAQGRFATQVQNMIDIMLEELGTPDNVSTEIGCMLLVDRDLDYATTLLTPVTYSGLLDEVFGISGGTVELDDRVTGGNGPVTYRLSSTDGIYDEIKNKHFSDVYSFLSGKTKELQQEFERSRKMALQEIKHYVSTQLQKVTTVKRSLSYHIGACEVIVGEMGHRFEDLHKVEQSMLEGRHRRDNCNYVEECMVTSGKITSLRLLSLMSLTQDGLSQDEATSLKTQFLHAYGYEHLVAFQNLEKLGLFTQQGSGLLASETAGKLADRVAQVVSLPKRGVFQVTAHKLKLYPNVSESYDLKNPKDMAYVFSGSYIPAVCQLVHLLIKQEQSIEEILKLIPSPSKWNGNSKTAEVAPRTFLVYFIGGITYAEIAAFQLLEKITGGRILVAGTSIIGGNTLIEIEAKISDRSPLLGITPRSTTSTNQLAAPRKPLASAGRPSRRLGRFPLRFVRAYPLYIRLTAGKEDRTRQQTIA